MREFTQRGAASVTSRAPGESLDIERLRSTVQQQQQQH
jgi:hypothetical protein